MATTDNKTNSTQSGDPDAVQSLLREALNPPNLITLSRLVLAFVLFVMIYINALWLTAAALFVVAAATDALDGYVARKYGMVTTLGRILDPFVDKIVICGAFIFLLDKKVDFENGVQVWSGVNAWMVVIVVGREMFVSSLRGFLEQQGKDFSASMSGKIKMVLQCVAVTGSLISLSPEVSSPTFIMVRDVMLWAAVIVTVWSGAIYVVRGAQMLKPDAVD